MELSGVENILGKYITLVSFLPLHPTHYSKNSIHFVGIAKHTFQTWINVGVLTQEKLMEVEARMDKITVPSDTGRIAKAISKCHTAMKADEWKHWTLIYSMFSLRTVLNTEHLKIWCLFVNACLLICQRAVTIHDVNQAHQLLKMFCKKFLHQYGQDYCVPNMHLSLHIKDCILDYGSVYGFWCFSFERYNGILGKYHTNNHSLTIQIMRKFVSNLQMHDEDDDEIDDTFYIRSLRLAAFHTKREICNTDIEFSFCQNISVASQTVLAVNVLDSIAKMMQIYYDIPIRISPIAKKFSRIEYQNQILATNKYRGGNSPYSKILARYPVGNESDLVSMPIRPSIITEILEIVVIKETNLTKFSMVVLNCQWLKETEYKHLYGIRNTNELWSTEFISSCYIPVQFVKGRCVMCMEKVFVSRIANLNCYDNFNIIIPLPSKSFL